MKARPVKIGNCLVCDTKESVFVKMGAVKKRAAKAKLPAAKAKK